MVTVLLCYWLIISGKPLSYDADFKGPIRGKARYIKLYTISLVLCVNVAHGNYGVLCILHGFILCPAKAFS